TTRQKQTKWVILKEICFKMGHSTIIIGKTNDHHTNHSPESTLQTGDNAPICPQHPDQFQNGFLGAINRLFDRLTQRVRRKKRVFAPKDMSDHPLADIGLRRAETGDSRFRQSCLHSMI
ncbi:hypothetical protein, partial [uncultured Thalassospira sp.]|uniref:hypothetical protein n=1 Tax=uncultured Thalassospira sp. TaxID=404382 RepID=UPI0030DD3AB2